MKLHPITGEPVPDEADRVPVMRPVGARPTVWPDAEFIVGNPPFIAGKDLRAELGDGYAEALWAAYPKVPKSADLALHFWWKAAQALGAGRVVRGRAAAPVTRRFGFITSNSIRQVFCRRVVAESMAATPPLHLVFAIPDHPWADGAGTAAVRIALTVAEAGEGGNKKLPVLSTVNSEEPGRDGVPIVTFILAEGPINSNLSIGLDVKSAKPLRANEKIAYDGVKLHGGGFIVTPNQATSLGLGRIEDLKFYIRPYRNGRDIQQKSRGLMVIDLFGMAEEEVRHNFPEVWQHLRNSVWPARKATAERSPDSAQYARFWWIFGKPRPELRRANSGLQKLIITVDTSKHRIFSFISREVIVDDKVVVISSDDAFILGVLQSQFHIAWMLAQEVRLEDRPVYAKRECFDPFPFPEVTPEQRAVIGELAEALDGHRKARCAAHPQLTLTGLYNVLEKIRAGTVLDAAERDVHEAGLVSILGDLHERLDAAVAAAYGWPTDLPAAEVVARVVALNAARVAEEAAGRVRWLRPEFQAPLAGLARPVQGEMVVDQAAAGVLRAWPRDMPGQYVALRQALAAGPATPRDLGRRFAGGPRGRKLEEMVASLAVMGQARALGDGRYAA